MHAVGMNLTVLPVGPGWNDDHVGPTLTPRKDRQMDEDAIDFVIAAWREDGHWQVTRLPKRTAMGSTALLAALSAHPAESGTLGFVSVAEDFFILVRSVGRGRARMLLSDVTAAPEWPLAGDVVDYLELPQPTDDDLDDITPAGDLTILADLGMSATELAVLTEDIDLYPDEVLSAVAKRLGFGDQFDDLLEPPG